MNRQYETDDEKFGEPNELDLGFTEPCSVLLTPRKRKIDGQLGFATLDKAAALALATATPLTDLRQYINSDLGYNDLKF